MFARIGTWEGTPEELERWIARGREQVKRGLARDPGLAAVSTGSPTARRAGASS